VTAWLRVPPRNHAPLPGRFFRGLGRLLASPGSREVDGASPAYFEWQAGTALGAWRYYSDFFLQDPHLVVDVGAGAAGRSAIHAQTSSATFVCLDRSPTLLAAARREGLKRGLESIAPVAGDAFSLPFVEGTFDAAVCENALEHLDRPDAALAEIQRVLKAEGRAFLLFPPWRSPYAGHLRWLTWLPWIHLLPPRLLSALLGGILAARPGGLSAWPAELTGLLAWLGSELNGWSLRRVLAAVRGTKGLCLLGAYVLGEGSLGRTLRFVPWAGELWASAVYLVLAKQPAGERPPRSYNGLLVWTLRGAVRRRWRAG
jgi:SAM-dependent methyltransferase